MNQKKASESKIRTKSENNENQRIRTIWKISGNNLERRYKKVKLQIDR